jgi:hypothetical protein
MKPQSNSYSHFPTLTTYMLLLFIILSCTVIPLPTFSASLPIGTVIYFASTTCPNSDWTPISDHRGRVFVAAPENTVLTQAQRQNASPTVSPYTDAELRNHNHLDSLTVASLASATVVTLGGAPPSCTSSETIYLKGGISIGSPNPGTSPSPSTHPGHAFTQLLACKLNTLTPDYQLPQDAVVFMDADSSPGPITSCSPTPSWQVFTPAIGRVIVPVDPPLVTPSWAPTSYSKSSPTPAMPSSQPDFTGHSHTVSASAPSVTTSNYSPTSSVCNIPPVSGTTVASPTAGSAISGSFAAAAPQIPFTRSLACQSTTGVSGGTQIPTGGLVFFAALSCPSGWTPVTTYKGRVIVNLPSSSPTAGTLFGSSTLLTLATSDVGLGAHTHSVSSYSFVATIPMTFSNYICTPSAGGSSGFCGHFDGTTPAPTSDTTTPHGSGSLKFTISSGSVTPSTADIPYITMLQCSKDFGTGSPVKAPSRAPSKNPSRAPSRNPSRAPSRNPGKVPSHAPSRNPSRTPVRKPSISPTHKPIIKPSVSPTPPTPKISTGTPTSIITPTSIATDTPTLKPNRPSITSAPNNGVGASNNDPAASDSLTAIIGGAVGGGVVLILTIIGLILWRRKRNSSHAKGSSSRTTPTIAGYLNMTKEKSTFPFVGGNNNNNNNSSSVGGNSINSSTTASTTNNLVTGNTNTLYPPITNPMYGAGLQPPPNLMITQKHISPRPTRPTNLPMSTSLSITPSSTVPQLRCIADFQAENPDELSINEGEMVRVLENHGEWVIAQSLQSGNIGMVPRNFLSF